MATDIGLSDLATIYGCCGLFDLCSDQDLMSLSFEGQNKFLDWIGWEKTNVCLIKKNFITFVRPERDAESGNRSVGYIQDPCGDSNGVEWGAADFELNDFGLLRRHGPERRATDVGKKLCDIQPRYRLDGTPIVNDVEFDMRLASEGMLQDLKHMIFDGNKTTDGQFDGLDRLIKTGYTDSRGRKVGLMDSIVINWNDNDLGGGSGITWNGKGISSAYNFIDVLMSVVRRIKDRLSMAPALSADLSTGDMILVAPSHILRCILDAFTCWSVCPGSTNVVVSLQAYEARKFRDGLNGGMFGDGQITIDGYTIPLLAYNWGLVDPSSGAASVYLLVGSIGNMKLISGQFLDMSAVPAGYPDADYAYTDGGKFLTWLDRQKTCILREVEMQPRLLLWAPWAQARFQDVFCDDIGGIISPDPWDSSFYPKTSFCVAACDTEDLAEVSDGRMEMTRTSKTKAHK